MVLTCPGLVFSPEKRLNWRMHQYRQLFVLLIMMLGWGVAQTQAQSSEIRGNLAEVRIVGVSDPTQERIIRASISARPGIPAARVDLEAERNLILSIGSFSEVSLSIEDRGQGPVLFIQVRENPTIAEVVLEGLHPSFDRTQLLTILNDQHLLTPGLIYNTRRAQEAIATIQQIYRESAGFPFEPPVTLDVQPVDEGAERGTPVRLVYTVTENVPLTEVTFEGNTVLEDEVLENIFAPLERTGEFNIEQYIPAVQEVERAYSDRGFRQSGVNRAATHLEGGTLAVRFQEYRIASIDTTAVGISPQDLTLQVGDLFNYDVLLQDIRRLAAGRSSDIRIDPVFFEGRVRVIFRTGPPESAGPVEAIDIEGNTVFTDEQLRELLILSEADTFTSALAEEDFRRLQAHYADAGYALVNQPDFNYIDGTYVQRIQEVRIAAYDVTFEGEEERTDETVITRYLPDVGSVFNQEELRRGLLQVARLGAVQPLTFNLTAVDPNVPTEALVTIPVREAQTRTFTPQLTYATDTGLTAAVSYGDTNFLGQAHSFNGEITAQSTPLGLKLGGSINYSIPWLYVDVLDFLEVPTSVSASLFSTVASGQQITDQGLPRVNFPGTNIPVFIGEYSQRDTGFGFSIGRPIFQNTTLRFSARFGYTAYYLEPPRLGVCDEEDLQKAQPDCMIPTEEAAAYLPQSGTSSFINTAVVYDDRDSIEYPRTGVAATGRLGLGFGSDFRNPETNEQQRYSYQQLEFGIKTYVMLQDIFPDLDDPNHVLAFRINAGHQFGGLYPTSRYFVVGDTPNEATQIRGYRREDFAPSRTYVTSSVEYRYDFGLDTFATQTIIGIVFIDLGYASSVPGFADYGTALFGSAGLGMQLNLGFGGFALPPIRLDYGFSQRSPSGRFSFRLGPVF
jgi:outer membrane protein insertion porin family